MFSFTLINSHSQVSDPPSCLKKKCYTSAFIFKCSLGEVYHQVYGRKTSFSGSARSSQ